MTPRKEILADGVELWLGDCREKTGYFHATLNGNGPNFISRKCTALHGRHSNSRSSTERFIWLIKRWSDRPFSLMEQCSLPPPPFLWLISKRRGSSHPHLTHATDPRPTNNSARRLYLRSYSRERSLGGIQVFNAAIFGLCLRFLTSLIAPQFGQGSLPKPEHGFHVQSHLRQLATSLIGVLPQRTL